MMEIGDIGKEMRVGVEARMNRLQVRRGGENEIRPAAR
jgi:hypothetical protein